MTIGLASQTVLPMQLLGQCARCAFGMEEAAGGIHGTVGRDAVLLADDVIFLAVAGRGVDRAGALFERHVVGQDAERIAFEERMAEDRAFQPCAGKARRALRLCPAALRGGASSSSAATI